MSLPSEIMGLNFSTKFSSIFINVEQSLNILAPLTKNIKIFDYDDQDGGRILDRVKSFHPAMKVIFGVPNSDLKNLSQNVIPTRLQTVIKQHNANISLISVGNEPLLGGDEYKDFLVPACNNLYSWLLIEGLKIGVTIAQNFEIVGGSWPPSITRIKSEFVGIIQQTCEVARKSGAPFMINIYPYYAHKENLKDVPLGYCLFQNKQPQFTDPNNGLKYFNIFDAQVDGMHAALKAIGCDDLEIVIGECGWPTFGGVDTTIENGRIFNQNLIDHCTSGKGTPLRPNKNVRCFIFEMYNENDKPHADNPVEPYWGWYHAQQEGWNQKYPLTWR